MAIIRDQSGRWLPGTVANPRGRPKGRSVVQELCRNWTEEAVQALADIMRDTGEKGPARVAAAIALLDRGYGKPAQPVDWGKELDGLSNQDLADLLPQALNTLGVKLVA